MGDLSTEMKVRVIATGLRGILASKMPKAEFVDGTVDDFATRWTELSNPMRTHYQDMARVLLAGGQRLSEGVLRGGASKE